MQVIPVSSMSGGQFWSALKVEVDAVSWNLRDVVLSNGSLGSSKLSLDRAIQSSERIAKMIAERADNFKQHIFDQRKRSGK